MDSRLPRSKRLKVIHDSISLSITLSSTSLTAPPPSPCYLLTIPEEVFGALMECLTLQELGILCLTSCVVRDRVINWTKTVPGLKLLAGIKLCSKLSPHKNIDSALGFSAWISAAKRFGIFVKRATLLISTKSRLECLEEWWRTVSEVALGKEDILNRWSTVCRVAGFSSALNCFFLGWDECEFGAVLALLNSQFSLSERLSHFLTSTVRTVEEESELRLILRCCFWDFCVIRPCWLSYLTNVIVKMSTQEIASVIFLMLGPTCAEKEPFSRSQMNPYQLEMLGKLLCNPNWGCFEDDVPDTHQEARQMFGELGVGLLDLTRGQAQESPEPVWKLFSAFFEDPVTKEARWSPDNISTFLLFTTESFVKKCLGYLVKKKDLNSDVSLAELLVSMTVVRDRLELDAPLTWESGVGKILRWTFGEGSRAAKKRCHADFWTEMINRLDDDDDFTVWVFIQLGELLSELAFSTITCPTIDINVTGIDNLTDNSKDKLSDSLDVDMQPEE